MQQPDMDSNASYATVFPNAPEPSIPRQRLGKRLLLLHTLAGDETNVFLRNGFLLNTRDMENESIATQYFHGNGCCWLLCFVSNEVVATTMSE
jgi:hypothetical protein